MHYIFDNNGVLDGTNRNDGPGKEKVTQAIIDAMIANGDTASIASKGKVNRNNLAARGFDENKFKHIFENAAKGREFFEDVCVQYETTVNQICMIDDDVIDVFILKKKVHINTIHYTGAEDLKNTLVQDYGLTI